MARQKFQSYSYINRSARSAFIRVFLFRLLLLTVCISISLLSAPLRVDAQTTLKLEDELPPEPVLRVSPVIVEKEIGPGKSLTEPLFIENISKNFIPVQVSAMDFAAKDEYGALDFYTEDRPVAAKDWVKLEPADLIIGPQSTRKVDVTINVPDKAEPGGRYVVVFFQPVLPETVSFSSGLAQYARVGVLFFITVSGEVIKKGSLERFDVAPIFRKSPIAMSIGFTSNGNVHLRPTGYITLTNLFGGDVGQMAVHEQGSLTALPGKTRLLTIKWNKPLGIGLYKASLKLEAGPDIQISSVRSFVVFPYHTVGLVIVVLLLYRKTKGRWRSAWRALRQG